MEYLLDNEHVMIALVQGEHGVEFRPSVLNVPTGTFVEWINQTDVSQHVFTNNSISFDLVPRAFTGTHILKAGSSRWQIQSNPHAYLTITASALHSHRDFHDLDQSDRYIPGDSSRHQRNSARDDTCAFGTRGCCLDDALLKSRNFSLVLAIQSQCMYHDHSNRREKE